MKSGTHRFALILLVVAIAVGAVAVGTLPFARDSEADIVPGSYSLTLGGSVAAGTITVTIAIEHDGSNPGNYQGVQWNTDYDQSRVAFVSASKTGPAPGDCDFVAPNDDGDRILVGCVNFGGNNISFSGVAFTATFSCLNPGSATFTLTNLGLDTFVQKTTGNQPIHIHDFIAECPAPPTETPTFTPSLTPTITSTPAPTDTPTNTPTATPTPLFSATPSPTAVPPGGNYTQITYDADDFSTVNGFLLAVDTDLETMIASGSLIADVTTVTLEEQIYLYGLTPGGPIVDIGVSGDVVPSGHVNFADVFWVLDRFGQSVPPWPGNVKFTTFDLDTLGSMTALLNAVDGAAESEIGSGWDPVGSAPLTFDASETYVLTLERRLREDRPADGDMDLNGRINFVDVFAVLDRFGFPKLDGNRPNRIKRGSRHAFTAWRLSSSFGGKAT
jgi:hypothetical protein